jgi:hypothetical protein
MGPPSNLSSEEEMVYSVNESVKVLALFCRGTMRPVRFSWRGVDYAVKQITFKWKDREGKAAVYHFAVSDGSSVFQLGYQPESLTWKLEAVDLEG